MSVSWAKNSFLVTKSVAMANELVATTQNLKKDPIIHILFDKLYLYSQI